LVTAVLGVTCLAAAVQGCMLVKAKWHEVVLLYAVAFLLIKPGLLTDMAGFVVFAFVLALQWAARKRQLTVAPL
jgi:TRAP-type uncharacterized transport system fused permease subunit